MRITVENWTEGFTVGGLSSSHLRYNDATTLFVAIIAQLQKLMPRMEQQVANSA